MNEVWIINGIPGSGKSTTARALASRLQRHFTLKVISSNHSLLKEQSGRVNNHWRRNIAKST